MMNPIEQITISIIHAGARLQMVQVIPASDYQILVIIEITENEVIRSVQRNGWYEVELNTKSHWFDSWLLTV